MQQEDRWSGKFPKKILTEAQKELIKKLQRAAVVASNNNRETLTEAAMAVLEFLPNSPVLAYIFSQIYRLTPEVQEEIRVVFNVANPGNNN